MKDFTVEQIKMISKKSLLDMYEKLSVQEISDKIGISSSTIFKRLRLFKIKVRRVGRKKLDLK